MKEIFEIDLKGNDGWTLKDLSELYNISISNVARICRIEKAKNDAK